MLEPPDDLVVLRTDHWLVNQCVDVAIPGYLIVGATDPAADRVSRLTPAAQAELGPLLARVHRAIEAELDPRIIYCVKWGHGAGHPVHFHVIPVFPWMEEALHRDERYRALQAFHGEDTWDLAEDYDGTEMCLFVRRESAEKAAAEDLAAAGREEVVRRLRGRIGLPP